MKSRLRAGFFDPAPKVEVKSASGWRWRRALLKREMAVHCGPLFDIRMVLWRWIISPW